MEGRFSYKTHFGKLGKELAFSKMSSFESEFKLCQDLIRQKNFHEAVCQALTVAERECSATVEVGACDFLERVAAVLPEPFKSFIVERQEALVEKCKPTPMIQSQFWSPQNDGPDDFLENRMSKLKPIPPQIPRSNQKSFPTKQSLSPAHRAMDPWCAPDS